MADLTRLICRKGNKQFVLPWADMREVGDHFTVAGGKVGSIRVQTCRMSAEGPRRFATFTVADGVRVMLVDISA